MKFVVEKPLEMWSKDHFLFSLKFDHTMVRGSVAVEMDHQPPNFVCSQVHKTRSVLETTQVKLAIR